MKHFSTVKQPKKGGRSPVNMIRSSRYVESKEDIRLSIIFTKLTFEKEEK